MAEWFRALEFNSADPGSNPALATNPEINSSVMLPPASWDSFLLCLCKVFLSVFICGPQSVNYWVTSNCFTPYKVIFVFVF